MPGRARARAACAVAVATAVALAGRSEAGSDVHVTTFPDGRIVVADASGGTVATLSAGGVVRATFVLDGGKVLAASRRDQTIFWDLETKQQTKVLPERAYAFAPDGKRFVTFSPDAKGGLALYDYPAMTRLRQLDTTARVHGWGPVAVEFSPDGSYLAVQYQSGYPVNDEAFLHPRSERKSASTIVLYDLSRGGRVPAFDSGAGQFIGEFSSDGRYYYARNPEILIDGRPYDTHRRFVLAERRWEDVPAT
jgi:Tol biopolymer transport system component